MEIASPCGSSARALPETNTSKKIAVVTDGFFMSHPMTTAAAIDRLVHHSVILELTGNSYRAMAAGLNPTRKEAKP